MDWDNPRAWDDPTTGNRDAKGGQRQYRRKDSQDNGKEEKAPPPPPRPIQIPVRPKAIREAADEQHDAWKYRIHKERCLLSLRVDNQDLADTDPNYIPPIRLGRLTDGENRYFIQVEHRVLHYEGDIPQQLNPNDPSGRVQVWPSYISLQVKLMFGIKIQSLDNEVDKIQSWELLLPAANHSSKIPQTNGHREIVVQPQPVIITPASKEVGIPEEELRRFIEMTDDGRERAYLRLQGEAGTLYYVQYETYARHLTRSNTFMIPSEDPRHQNVADYVERLHSEELGDRKLTIGLIFWAPAAENESVGCIKFTESLEKFVQAQNTENTDPLYINRIYGVSPVMAFRSVKKSKKEVRYLPDVRIRVPLVYPSCAMWALTQTTDLQLMHYNTMKANQEVYQMELQCRTLLLDDGTTRTFTGLIRTPEDFPSNASIQPNTSGQLFWVGRQMLPWNFIITWSPKIALGTDFAIIMWPNKNQDSKELPTSLPMHIINVKKQVNANTLEQAMETGKADMVRLKITNSNKTERQQFAALVKANPFTNGPDRDLDIANKVYPILAGHNLKKLEEKSVYSEGFAERILNDPTELNTLFAKGIDVPGATLSNEQLEFVLGYPSRAPSDGLLIAQGHAGTRKTSSAGAFAIAQYLDVVNEHHKTGIIVTEMHNTANHTVQAIGNIVKAGTGKLVIREYGCEQDIRTMLFALDGCPEEYNARWSHGMDASEHADMMDLTKLMSESLRKTYGSKHRKFSAVRHTAIWHILQEMNLIEYLQGKHKYPKSPLTAPPVDTEIQYIDVSSSKQRLLHRLSYYNDHLYAPGEPCETIVMAVKLSLESLGHECLDQDETGLSPWLVSFDKAEQVEHNEEMLVKILDNLLYDIAVIVFQLTEDGNATVELPFDEPKGNDFILPIVKNHEGQYCPLMKDGKKAFRILIQGSSWNAVDGFIDGDDDEPLSKSQKQRIRRQNREEGIPAQPPPPREEYTDEQLNQLTERAMKAASGNPEDEFQKRVYVLVQLLREALSTSKTKRDMNTATDMLKEIKAIWLKKHAAVLVTTISQLKNPALEDFGPAWTLCEEAQYISVHNITIWLTKFHAITRYMIGDIEQLAPYCEDGDRNIFSEVRRRSLLAQEIRRGRPHVTMSVSGRAGPIAIRLPSELCYDGNLTSNIAEHPQTNNIMDFHKKIFGCASNSCPHMFIDAGVGEGTQVGYRKSTVNVDLMNATKTYIEAYARFAKSADKSHIGVIAPWGIQNAGWVKDFRGAEMGPSSNTTQGIMGQEKVIALLEIAKTDSVGFMNMHGMFPVALTRSKASTVIIANHSALMSSLEAEPKRRRQFFFYNKLVQWFKNNNAFVSWPDQLEKTTDMTTFLDPTMRSFRRIQGGVVDDGNGGNSEHNSGWETSTGNQGQWSASEEQSKDAETDLTLDQHEPPLSDPDEEEVGASSTSVQQDPVASEAEPKRTKKRKGKGKRRDTSKQGSSSVQETSQEPAQQTAPAPKPQDLEKGEPNW